MRKDSKNVEARYISLFPSSLSSSSFFFLFFGCPDLIFVSGDLINSKAQPLKLLLNLVVH